MAINVGINGFGRIGRLVFRRMMETPEKFNVVGINDLSNPKDLAILLKYDSTHGRFKGGEVTNDDANLIVNGKKIPITAEKNPADIPWAKLGADVVLESTGRFTSRAKDGAAGYDSHLQAGARKVVLSAPAKDDIDLTCVLGVNDSELKPEHKCVSNASCTTNCLAPIVKVLVDEFGIDKGLMTTVHSYTASQRLQDAPAKDLREARAAAENIVPTTTGASKAAALTIPSLKGKFNGLSVRVPTPVVSLADITAVLKRDTTVEEINKVFKKAVKQPFYEGIVDVTEEELVSTDFRGNAHSSIVDLPLTDVIGGNLVKVVAWYDNEWGYSNRLVELAVDFGKGR